MSNQFPIWDDRYEKIGVSPQELYLRQQGLCYLKQTVNHLGEIVLVCTDGLETALTANLLNPTFECVKCLTGFTCKVIKEKLP